jgi:hypothetical protein
MSASIVEYLTHNPPRCLSGLKPGLVSVAADEVVWQLRCACGSDAGIILGYQLGDLKPGFEGSGLMVSPFRFRCGGCEREAEFLDTDIHGEASEFAAMEGSADGCAVYRGEGEPTEGACPSCRGRSLWAAPRLLIHPKWEYRPIRVSNSYFFAAERRRALRSHSSLNWRGVL